MAIPAGADTHARFTAEFYRKAVEAIRRTNRLLRQSDVLFDSECVMAARLRELSLLSREALARTASGRQAAPRVRPARPTC